MRLTATAVIPCILLIAASASALASDNSTSNVKPFEPRDAITPEPPVLLGVGCADCPPGEQLEGEPTCGPGYVDAYNGGCQGGNTFLPVTCSVVCGQTGTYVAGALTIRDLDFYQITVGPGNFTVSGIADGFTLLLNRVDATCLNLTTSTTPSCVQSTPLNFTGPGTFMFLATIDFATPHACGASPYRLTFSGPGVPDCTPPTGACCLDDGSCSVVTQANCASQGGGYQGDGTACDPNPCPPVGACCFEDGICSMRSEAECNVAGGVYQGDGTDCSPHPCPLPPTGACCNRFGDCSVTTQANCVGPGEAYAGDGTTCDPNPCIGACCTDAGCTIASPYQCAVELGGVYQGPATNCDDPAPCLGACCVGDGCQVTSFRDCNQLEGNYLGNGTDCDPDPCATATGACCFPDGTCAIARRDECESQGGTFVGAGSACDPYPCVVPVRPSTWGQIKNIYR